MKPEKVTKPFIAFLRDSKLGGAQYLTFDGGQFQVITFADDDAAVAYRDAMMAASNREWTFGEIEVSA